MDRATTGRLAYRADGRSVSRYLMRRLAARVGSSPGGQVALLCIGQLGIWAIAAALLTSAPELDGAEQLVWAGSLQMGYWKHPPLPTWIMHGLVSVFGASPSLPLIAAQACVVTALALTWRLACEFMSPQRAVAAMALTSLITYYNVGADAFNHSVALLPFEMAATLMFYRATRFGGYWRWALVGLFAGLSLLVKYLALLPLCGLILYVVLDTRMHRRQHLQGVALAIVIAAATLWPHMMWLRENNYLPFRYAHSVVTRLSGMSSTLKSAFDFSLIQALRMLPFAAAMCLSWRAQPGSPSSHAAASSVATTRGSDRLFLAIGLLAPLGFTVLFSLLTQSGLQARWGTSCFALVGIVGALWLARCNHLSTGRIIVVAICLQILMCLGMVLVKTIVSEQLHRRTRANFPAVALARHVHDTWNTLSKLPLRVVVTDIWIGGNLIAKSPPGLSVMIDGDPAKSPWVDEPLLEACGALVVTGIQIEKHTRSEDQQRFDDMMNRSSLRGVWNLTWAGSRGLDPDGSTAEIHWGFIAPTSGQRCD